MMDNRDYDQPDITHREITAVVKWFNPTKGFGFVQPSDGSPDAFMHVSVVTRSGIRHLPEGATIVCDLCAGPKGPQVAEVHRIEDMPEAPPPRGGYGGGGGYGAGHGGDRGGDRGGDHGASGPASEIEGTVKFYNRDKGFGFVVPDDGSKDVFVSARILERAGLQNLGPEQRVRMMVRSGQKGPMADSVEVI
jgi:CspA family cold shock protein